MKAVVLRPHLTVEMGVDLRRHDRRVPQHLLERPHVHPAGQQVRREAVPQDVRIQAGPCDARRRAEVSSKEYGACPPLASECVKELRCTLGPDREISEEVKIL